MPEILIPIDIPLTPIRPVFTFESGILAMAEPPQQIEQPLVAIDFIFDVVIGRGVPIDFVFQVDIQEIPLLLPEFIFEDGLREVLRIPSDFTFDSGLRTPPIINPEFIFEVAIAPTIITPELPGLVAHWEFESSPWVDKINSFLISQISGTSQALTGYSGNAIQVGVASASIVAAPLNPTLGFGNQDWGLGFWFKLDRLISVASSTTLIACRVPPSGTTEWSFVIFLRRINSEDPLTDPNTVFRVNATMAIRVSNGFSNFLGSFSFETNIVGTRTEIQQDWHFVLIQYNDADKRIQTSLDNAIGEASVFDFVAVQLFAVPGSRITIAAQQIRYDDLKVYKP